MAIGLSAKQKKDLAGMLPNVEESVASLKRLIADAKDRAKALAKLDEAEQVQRKHAGEVGIPFNAEAFARRRAELNALPKMLTVEEGQLASFSALQRAIGVVVGGPYTREGRGTPGARRQQPATRGAATKGNGKKSGAKPGRNSTRKGTTLAKSSPRASLRSPRSGVTRSPSPKQPSAKSAPAKLSSAKASPRKTPITSSEQQPASAARMPVVKPLPLALGS